MNSATYFLLTFNEDYADEHNVPALACMTEQQYNEWLETPSGKINENYEEELKHFNESVKKYNEYQALLRKNVREKSEKARKELEELGEVKYINSIHDKPKKIESKLHARLGNSGEGFEESYEHLYLMKEFVDSGIVKVTTVGKAFYMVFHEAKLDRLSLCNVFTIKKQ